MKTKLNRKGFLKGRIRSYLIAIGIVVVILLFFSFIKSDPQLIEHYYSRGFYPYFAYLPKWLFGWIPFSIGDLFYTLLPLVLIYLSVSGVRALLKKDWSVGLYALLRLIFVLLFSYLYFYMSWGLNYYRIPLQEQFALKVDSLEQEDYLEVLERYIDETNALRVSLDTTALDRKIAREELEVLMKESDLRLPMLSRTQIQAKQPISSTLVSYFSVTGYLNPFTQEVQVNALAPQISYPFTVVHELSHQMGIGFEDECNFLAFLMLYQHTNTWYRYAAYSEAVQYLLRPLYNEDKELYLHYRDRLSATVKADYERERLFWKKYRGPIDQVMGIFYNGYLQHNNQPEGMSRYSLVSRLIVAWEKKKKG